MANPEQLEYLQEQQKIGISTGASMQSRILI